MFLKNDPKLKERRKELRKRSTPQENLLWLNLRQKKLGCKFSRQYSFGPYILDFYCVQNKIAIELDGNQHRENKEYDIERDSYLNANAIKVLRFWNNELKDIDTVLDRIKKEISSTEV